MKEKSSLNGSGGLSPTTFISPTVARAASIATPIHGFRDASDYWHRASGGRFVAGIDRPMLAIVAADDPFLPPGIVPHAAIAANPYVSLVLTTRGGHCGFISGPPWSPSAWAEQATVEYLARHLPS